MTAPDLPLSTEPSGRTEMADPIVEIRLPLSSWQGIVNGIEKWVGDSMSEIEILADFEFTKIPDGYYEEGVVGGVHYIAKDQL